MKSIHHSDSKRVLEVLCESSIPLKARDLVLALKRTSGVEVDKSTVNRTLYAFLADGFVTKDVRFRWSIVGAGVECAHIWEVRAREALALIEEQRLSVAARKDRGDQQPPLQTKVGHWEFMFERKENARERWTFRCALCHFAFRSLDHCGRLLPLTGNARRHRRKHDRQNHPDEFRSQTQAEKEILGH